MGDRFVLHHGDCREVMASLPDESVDAIVTDPPYELGFMGKAWDAAGVAYDVALWSQALRVLKPGGHLLAFGGSRTYHRLASAIEDAGFEIRDQIMWVYGSGFPKSLDVSKAIDRRRYDREDIYRVTAWIRSARDAAGITNRDIDEAFGANGMGRHWTDVPPMGNQPAVPTLEQVPMLLDTLGVRPDEVPHDIRRLLYELNGRKGQPGENWAKREVVGAGVSGATAIWSPNGGMGQFAVTAPATDAAREWDGWGTALKPAHEPIVVARKPLISTVAENVLAYGTGALNIDGCRVYRADGDDSHAGNRTATFGTQETVSGGDGSGGWTQSEQGRWPANFIHDGDQTVLDLFPRVKTQATRTNTARETDIATIFGPRGRSGSDRYLGESGSAARFFYCAKASKRDRDEGNHHPTVKPTALMRYLVRLVTPPGGVVLDLFTGSGSTGKAAMLEGLRFVGIEQDAEYLAIARARIASGRNQSPR